MTRPSNSSLVLDGSQVKYRLQAERQATKTPVHVDWIRFTVLCRNQPAVSFDSSASFARGECDRLYATEQKIRDLVFPWTPRELFTKKHIDALIEELDDPDYHPSMQALQLAFRVAGALGPDFTVCTDVGKGHDFYKYRWVITRNDSECGWVGFLASGDSPKQQSQAKTLHVNLFGGACTFAQIGFGERLANLIDELDGVLTRCDLALDFFDGYPGGIRAIFTDYKQGLCNVRGRKPSSNTVGDWANDDLGNKGRSFYWGSRQAGKVTNAYEKGTQLFGPDVCSSWLRVELRYGNKLRVLSSDMLRRPADFFAGASDWHASALALADTLVIPESVPTTPPLPILTVEAECFKNLRWAMSTAAPTVAALFTHLGDDGFLELVTNKKLPGRLQKFSSAELGRAFTSAMGRFTDFFTRSEGVSPPFAPA